MHPIASVIGIRCRKILRHDDFVSGEYYTRRPVTSASQGGEGAATAPAPFAGGICQRQWLSSSASDDKARDGQATT
jgi:hypothetical protein